MLVKNPDRRTGVPFLLTSRTMVTPWICCRTRVSPTPSIIPSTWRLEVVGWQPLYAAPLLLCAFTEPFVVEWQNIPWECSPKIATCWYIIFKIWIYIPFQNMKEFVCLSDNPPPRSMGSTLRTRANPLGRHDSEAVRQGNLLCCRALVLVLLMAAKGIFWTLEQPSSSTMEWHPLFQRLLRLLTIRRLTFKMSQFGAPTPKRTILYSGSFAIFLVVVYIYIYIYIAQTSRSFCFLDCFAPQVTDASLRSWTTLWLRGWGSGKWSWGMLARQERPGSTEGKP